MNGDNIEPVPPERWEWIDRFIRALGGEPIERRSPDLAILTLDELAQLEFLQWRLDHGKVAH